MASRKTKNLPYHAAVDKLLGAIRASDVSEVQSILSQPLDVNILDNKKKTPLFYAINSNNPAIVEALIQKGANVNCQCYAAYHRDNKLYCSVEAPTVTAARTGNFEALKLLVEAGADIDAQGELRIDDHVVCKDRCALHFACEDCRPDMVELLLLHNADVHLEDRGKETALHKSVRCGKNCAKQCQIIQWLCEHGSDVDHTDKLHTSPLYLATFYGCLKKMEILLLYGADVNRFCEMENSYGTPLHIAAAKDQVQMAQLLILHGSQLNIRNALDCTPLQLNINSMIRSSITQHLIYHGADVDGVDKWEYTLLGACMRNMRLDCEQLCKLIVYSGCDMSKEDWLKPVTPDGTSDNQRIPIPSGRMEELYDWLTEQQSNPLCLTDLTRISIRKHLSKLTNGRSIVSSVKSLPLPPALRDIVLLTDWVDLSVTPSNTKVFGKLL